MMSPLRPPRSMSPPSPPASSASSATDSPQDQAGRYLLRPARADDLPALERLAAASAIGITSLPEDLADLRARLEHSCASFANGEDTSGEESYLFVLEDGDRGGALIGTAGIAAAAGFNDRFYSYRNEFIVQASAALGARNRIHTLHLCHDLSGVTLLTGFHIDPTYEATLAPQLLSRGRLMYIAAFPERFSDRVAAENPGVADDNGQCPFWDAVGRRFFAMDYPTAERLSGGRSPKAYIAELMPQSPIYVPLLPEPAQCALGQLHPVGELPFGMLMDEGMDGDTYVNLFDGGPTAIARLDQLRTVQRARLRPWAGLPADATRWQMVGCGGAGDFRLGLRPPGTSATGATNAASTTSTTSAPFDLILAERLGLAAETPIWCAELDHAGTRP